MPIELVNRPKMTAKEFETAIVESLLWQSGFEVGIEQTRLWIRNRVDQRTAYTRLWKRYKPIVYAGADARMRGTASPYPRFGT